MITHVFVDTLYWISVINPKDQWHKPSRKAATTLGEFHQVTTEAILIELLTFFCSKGPFFREKAAELTHKIYSNNDIIVVPQTKKLFNKSLDFYAQRHDKKYSFTDCISMTVMNDKNIKKILTYDKHFEQAGFEILIK